MANLLNTNINDTGYLRLPIGTDADRPADEVGAVRLNSNKGIVEYWDGYAWESNSVAFPHRTIITTSYVLGGYKSAVVWNNVNKCFTQTDTTINLGDNSVERAFNYQWGACSKDYAYVFGAGNAHVASSNYVIAFNMRTETNATDISRNLSYNRIRLGGVFQEDVLAFTVGGGSANIEEYNMVTKSVVSVLTPTYTSTWCWGASHETYGIMYTSNDNRNFTFATRTLTSRSGTTISNHHQQKSVQSKHNYCWAGNNGSY